MASTSESRRSTLMDGLRSIGRRGSAQVKAGLEKQSSTASLGGLPPQAEVDPDHEEASPTLEFHGTADIHVTVLTVDISPAAQFGKNRRELDLEIMFKVRCSAEETATRDDLPALTGIHIARMMYACGRRAQLCSRRCRLSTLWRRPCGPSQCTCT